MALEPEIDLSPEPGPVPGPGPERSDSLPQDEAGCADPVLLADFVQESCDHLETAEARLMALEGNPGVDEGDEALNTVFRAFHTIKGVAGFLGLHAIQAFAHGMEDLLDKARQGALPAKGGFLDLALQSVDVLKQRMQGLGASPHKPCPADLAEAMRRILRQAADFQEGPVPEPADPIPDSTGTDGSGGNPVDAEAATGHAVRRDPRPAEAGASGAAARETVKVEAERLDRLLEAIGELVIAESMIVQSPELRGARSPALARQLGRLDKITRELQQMGTSLRMVPLRPLFQKMARLARDLSRTSEKEVEFQSAGGDTELDRTVVDRIGDPLMHMMRNAVDHGIEGDARVRAAAGKPARARVRLGAFQKGGSVCIQVADDGRGLSRSAILRKARERGLLEDEGTGLSDAAVWSFIFEPGFSTAAKVTEISGRGVGMDVVRRNIEALRGRIEIESREGEGTTFSIWLPLTLAIIDGMIVRLGGRRYVLPTLSILRIVPVRASEIRIVQGRGEALCLQDEIIPLSRLDRLLPEQAFGEGDGIGTEKRATGRADMRQGLAVIVETEGRKAGLIVDELLGQQQVVIKSLGQALARVDGVSGGAILPDGTVGIILDVEGLLKSRRASTARDGEKVTRGKEESWSQRR